MSSIIKIGGQKRNLTIKIVEHVGGVESESEDEYMQRLEEEKQEQIFNAGREAAIKELKESYSESLNQKFSEYDSMLISIEEQINLYKTSFDKIVLDTSFLVANKIITNSIAESPIITETIKEAVRKIIGADNIVIRLNPNDLELIKESKENFMDNSSYSNLKFEADDRIEIGGCFVESEIGNVDARISSQLSELKNVLKQEINPED